MGIPGLDRALHAARSAVRTALRFWARLRAWRRIRFTLGGVVFTVGAGAVGFAAVNTGNNLLYLLLGAMLGFIAVSGWFSERMMRDLEIRREVPRGVTAGQEARIGYHVKSRRKRIPTLALEISEAGLPARAFLARLPAGGEARARSYNRLARRGAYPLSTLTLSTSFPFGLFLKERDLTLPGELVIWPRSGRPVRPPAPGGGDRQRRVLAASGAPGLRGEYRALREYRVGDDPRDIHWKTSARLRNPVVREYDTDAAEDLWICLDTRGTPGEAAETMVEVAASLAAGAAREGSSFGFVAEDRVLPPASGPGHLEDVLDLLARVQFTPSAPPPQPPVAPERCVLVSLGGEGRGRFGDAYLGGPA